MILKWLQESKWCILDNISDVSYCVDLKKAEYFYKREEDRIIIGLRDVNTGKFIRFNLGSYPDKIIIHPQVIPNEDKDYLFPLGNIGCEYKGKTYCIVTDLKTPVYLLNDKGDTVQRIQY